MRSRLHRPSPALVIACAALGISLAGTSYAAVTLPRNSVGTAQLMQGAVVSSKVRDGSLLAADLRRGEVLGGVVTVVGPRGTVGARTFGLQMTRCPDGFEAIGGGIDVGNVSELAITSSQPFFDGFPPGLLALAQGTHRRSTGWRGTVRNDAAAPREFVVAAVCARTR